MTSKSTDAEPAVGRFKKVLTIEITNEFTFNELLDNIKGSGGARIIEPTDTTSRGDKELAAKLRAYIVDDASIVAVIRKKDILEIATTLESTKSESLDALEAAHARVAKRIEELTAKIQAMKDAGYVSGALEGVCKDQIDEIWLLSWVFPDLAPDWVRERKADIERITKTAKLIGQAKQVEPKEMRETT